MVAATKKSTRRAPQANVNTELSLEELKTKHEVLRADKKRAENNLRHVVSRASFTGEGITNLGNALTEIEIDIAANIYAIDLAELKLAENKLNAGAEELKELA